MKKNIILLAATLMPGVIWSAAQNLPDDEQEIQIWDDFLSDDEESEESEFSDEEFIDARSCYPHLTEEAAAQSWLERGARASSQELIVCAQENKLGAHPERPAVSSGDTALLRRRLQFARRIDRLSKNAARREPNPQQAPIRSARILFPLAPTTPTTIPTPPHEDDDWLLKHFDEIEAPTVGPRMNPAGRAQRRLF
jgi:hypothetical protein